MTLHSKTILLQKYLIQLQNRFQTCKPPKSVKDRSFFKQMKEETKPIYELLSEWKSETLKFIANGQSKLFPHQIEATVENIEMIILHSYYIDIRRRFYMEYFNSTIYILEQLLTELTHKFK